MADRFDRIVNAEAPAALLKSSTGVRLYATKTPFQAGVPRVLYREFTIQCCRMCAQGPTTCLNVAHLGMCEVHAHLRLYCAFVVLTWCCTDLVFQMSCISVHFVLPFWILGFFLKEKMEKKKVSTFWIFFGEKKSPKFPKNFLLKISENSTKKSSKRFSGGAMGFMGMPHGFLCRMRTQCLRSARYSPHYAQCRSRWLH